VSIVGIGTDIVSVPRLRAAVERHGERFAERILADTELAEWRRRERPIALLAKRFAAKEAAAKALGTGIAQGVTLKSLTVEHDTLGKPVLCLHGAAAARAAAIGAARWHLSLSDERDLAAAFVVLETG